MSDRALVVRNDEYTTLTTIAKVAVASQYHKMSEAQAVYVVLKGYELGMAPLQSIDSIDVIQGKPTLKPQAMLALINQSGLLQDIQVDVTDAGATCVMVRRGRTAHTETFTMQDAAALGLAGKDNWKKQPRTMLKWRVIAAAARVVFPDVIQGCYTAEELGAEVVENVAGEQTIIMDVAPEPPAPDTEPAPSPFPAPADVRLNRWKGDVAAAVRLSNNPYWRDTAHIQNAITGLLNAGALASTMTPADAAMLLARYAALRDTMDGPTAIETLINDMKEEAQS